MKKFALALSVVLLMCGCGSAPTAPIAVTISPALAPNLDQGQTSQFTAVLAGDTSGKGVLWTVSGPGCTGAACGSFINQTTTSATYRAPAAVTTALNVTVTANSVAQPSQYASTTFSIVPPPSIITTGLPAATPSYVYHTQLTADGGVQPLNWTVAGGTLPAGMALNGSGVLYGVPTTGGTSTFTVKVTDSSTAPSGPLSAQQTLSITVVGILTVPPATFPNGTIGIAYSASLPVSGGLPPYSWTIYSGSLPSGLLLQTNGVISGTPTVVGAYTFSVTVVDSSPVQQTFTSSNFTITINPAGPLTIRTTAMMDGSVGTPYQGQLVATGGSPPLDWSVTAGALPPGLAISPLTGAISGTPSTPTGTYSFTVQVSDTSSPPQTATQQLAITTTSPLAACSSSGNNSVLFGQYAFNLRGYNGAGYLAVVGSFTADGAGNISAGEADTNGVLGAQTGNLITSASSYSVGPDNRGCATIATPFGTFYTRFALGAVSAGVAAQGRIIEFENPGANAYIAAGEVLQQNPGAFISSLTGTYGLRVSGWDPSTSGRFACAGLVIGASHTFSYLEQDCNDNGTVTNTINTVNNSNSLVNTYSAADMNGRGTGSLSVGQATSSFVFYWVSTAQLLVVNSDPAPVFAGDWLQEQIPPGKFQQGSFSGDAGFYASGLAPSGAGGDVAFGTEAADGVNSVSARIYRDVAGAAQTTSPVCSYSVVSIGRVTLSGNNCGANPPIFYLLTPLDSALVVGTDAAMELGSFAPQTTGLTNSAVAGTYFVGTSEVVSQSAPAEVGIVTLASNGVLTSTTDTSTVASQTVGTAGFDTYSLNTDGTFGTGSSGGAVVGLAIAGNEFVVVSNPTLTFPTLQIGQR